MNLEEVRDRIYDAVDSVYGEVLTEQKCSGDIAPLQSVAFDGAIDRLTEILTSMVANNGTIQKIRGFIDRNGGKYKFPKDYMMMSAENDEIFPVRLYRRGTEYLIEYDEGDWLEINNIGDLGDRDLILLAEELGL